MSVTIDRITTPPTPEPLPLPLRLCLKPPGGPSGLLDGAWWPRTRDLLRELPPLTDVLDPLWGRITRVAVNPLRWPVIPRKVPVNGHVVKVGWFVAEQDPHKLLLLSGYAGRWDLLVVPPETDAASAQWLMSAAADPYHSATASALVEAEHSRSDDISQGLRGEARRAESGWEGEGGALTHPITVPTTRGRAIDEG